MPDTRKIAAPVGQIAITREAVPHHVVGGLVALESRRGSGKSMLTASPP